MAQEFKITSTDILEFFKPEKEEHASALRQMREQFPDEQNVTDSDLARFLIARKFVLEDAVEMLKKHLEWRDANPPVKKSDCLASLEKKTTYCHGFDVEGHPLLVFRSALHNPKDRDIDECNRMLQYWMEHALVALPDDKTKFTILIDRTDAGMANHDLDFVKSLSSLWQDNFPERVYRLVVYPSGMIFYGIWNIVQFFLDPVTKEKVKPCYNASGVAAYIDPKFLPASMNGTCTYELPPVEELPETATRE